MNQTELFDLNLKTKTNVAFQSSQDIAKSAQEHVQQLTETNKATVANALKAMNSVYETIENLNNNFKNIGPNIPRKKLYSEHIDLSEYIVRDHKLDVAIETRNILSELKTTSDTTSRNSDEIKHNTKPSSFFKKHGTKLFYVLLGALISNGPRLLSGFYETSVPPQNTLTPIANNPVLESLIFEKNPSCTTNAKH